MASLASSFLYSERWIRIAAIYVELIAPCLMAARGTSFQRTSSDLQRRVAWHPFIRNLALAPEQYASRRSALGCRSHVRHPNVRLSFVLLRVDAVVTFVKTTGVDFPAPYHMASRGCSILCIRLSIYLSILCIRREDRRRDARRRFPNVVTNGIPTLVFPLLGILCRRQDDRLQNTLRWIASIRPISYGVSWDGVE
jgi:hypothetical protein